MRGAGRFEEAADAVVSGDIETLRRLLREEPGLVHARSEREHHATLLHYVAANGVEEFRQKAPPNIVEIAELLLEAGADVDATADMYGGGATTLGLAATSIHPERAGVQEALLQTLLDHGAANSSAIVRACLANGRPRAAAFLANRGVTLDLAAAAGLGRLDLVKTLVTDASPSIEQQLEEGFRYACAYGHNDVVRFALARGVNLGAQGGGGHTALHLAVIGGHVETVKLLLQHKPPLEVRNVYGGTVLGQAMWSAGHGGDPAAYSAIQHALMAAGAKAA